MTDKCPNCGRATYLELCPRCMAPDTPTIRTNEDDFKALDGVPEDDDWELEQRAFSWANSNLPEDAKTLIKDLWCEYCKARATTQLARELVEQGERIAELVGLLGEARQALYQAEHAAGHMLIDYRITDKIDAALSIKDKTSEK